MQNYTDDHYRQQLQDDAPSFFDRVNTPWDEVPDLAEYNRHAFSRIERALKSLVKTASKRTASNSQGVLVLGEAGTGKTHLLMRVAQRFSATNPILFIRKPNNEEAIAQHIWQNMIVSICSATATAPSKDAFDNFLVSIFEKILIEALEEDIRDGVDTDSRQKLLRRVRENPQQLGNLPGEGERRSANIVLLRRRVMRYLQVDCPEVDQRIAHALITYCFVRRDDRKFRLRNWLVGQDLSEPEANDLGLPTTWAGSDETSSEVSSQQQREEQALRAIRTLGILSTFAHPLILAFDQLEGLRNRSQLTDNWGDLVREIFTMTPNLLVVTCIWPSLWENWLRPKLDQSVVERLAQQTVTLEAFGPQHATNMLATHLRPAWEKHRLPTSTYPFDAATIDALCQQASSPRLFLQGARARFDAWLDQVDAPPLSAVAVNPPAPVSQDKIDAVLREALETLDFGRRSRFEAALMTEQELFGRVKNIVETMLSPCATDFELETARYKNYVMPPNLIVRSVASREAVCLAIMNSEGNSFYGRIKNLKACAEEGVQFSRLVILRDRSCQKLGARSEELLTQLRDQGAILVQAGSDEFQALNALYRTLVNVEENDLCVDQYTIGMRQFVEFARSERSLAKSEFLQRAAEANPAFAAALGLAGNAAPAAVAPPTPPTPVEISPLAPSAQTETPPKPAKAKRAKSPPPASVPNDQQPGVEQPKAIQTPAAVVIGATSLTPPHLGIVGDFRDDGRRLAISLTKPQGLIILGYMGSGKSYALGTLIENALLSQPGLITQARPMSVVAFNYRRNPNSRFEYGGFAVPNHNPAEIAALAARYGVSPQAVDRVQVFGYEPELSRRTAEHAGLKTFPIQYRSAELSADHWEILMKAPGNATEYMAVIRDIIQKLYYEDRLTLHNLERYIESDERLSAAQQRKAKNRLAFAQRWIRDERSYDWSDVLTEGTLNVFDLRMQVAEPDDALKLCLIVTDLVRRTKNGVNKMVVFDEAHEYVDCKQLVGELENALTQIRHDGLSFVLASQFPEKIPKSIFRYLLTRLIFKLPTLESIEYLRSAAPNLQALSPKRIANLDLEQGLCFIQTDDDSTDASLRTPQAIAVRPRCSQHGGATIRQLATNDPIPLVEAAV